MSGPAYDCQACGACCLEPFGGHAYVSLSVAEAGRMRRHGLAVIQAKQGLCLRTVAVPGWAGVFACPALRGEVGKACSCSVYADRPEVCRQFEPGGLMCRDARRAAGLSTEPQ